MIRECEAELGEKLKSLLALTRWVQGCQAGGPPYPELNYDALLSTEDSLYLEKNHIAKYVYLCAVFAQCKNRDASCCCRVC